MAGDGSAGEVEGPRGRALWQRADQVLPGGGIYLTRSARFAGAGVLPGFVAEARGCRVTDVDGRSYLDFLCANGPNLLGYRHPEVEEAACRQAASADAASFFPPALVDLSEALVARTPGARWAVVAKNGSDAVALACRVARIATGRKRLLLFQRAYHGFDPELLGLDAALPHGGDVVRVPWNDAEAVERIARAQDDTLAGIVLNPLDQNPGADTVAPAPDFLAAIAAARERTGAQLVLDDVRHGFRLHPDGTAAALGTTPDLHCYGKALGNGHAVAALAGSEPLRAAVRRIPFTASFLFGAVALRAARATLEVYQRERVFARIERAGLRLRDGMEKAAFRSGHRIRWSGPPAMPTLLFADDPQLVRGRRFATEAARRGALFHPSLNWFLCAAHDDAAIDEAVAIAGEAFAATPADEGG